MLRRKCVAMIIVFAMLLSVVLTISFEGNVRAATLLSDDFSNGTANWTVDSGTWAIESGEYSQSDTTAEQAFSFAGSTSSTNYTFEADVKTISSVWDTGMAFRVTDSNNLYLLAIRSNSSAGTKLQIFKRVSGSWTSLGTANPSILDNTFYHYKIVLLGDNIKVYFNNSSTATIDINDSAFSSGKIGLRTGLSHGHFDNVLVSDNESTTPTSTPEANYNVALNKTATTSDNYSASYDGEKAIDGSNAMKWNSTNSTGDKWLKVDLGGSYEVTRWVVKHAQAGGEQADLNTSDFKLQKSSDGSTWTDVDTVTGNTSSATDRNVTSFITRYLRLYITKCNPSYDNTARIYELEIWGTTGSGATPTPTPNTYTFSDDFNDGYADGWALNNGTWAVESGEYSQNDTSAVQAFSFIGDSVWADYTYETDIKTMSMAWDAGIAFRVTNANNLYLLAIRSNSNTENKLELFKRVNGTFTSLGTANPTIYDNTLYHYKIVTSGSNIKVYFNGGATASIDINDSTFTQGKIGLRTGQTHVHFDNINVNVTGFGATPTPLPRNINVGYLLEDNFAYLKAYLSSTQCISGWDVDTSYGSYNYVYQTSFAINDSSNSGGVTMSKRLASQTSGKIVLEYRYNVNTTVDGITWQLRSGTIPAVKILTSGGNLCYENSSGTTLALQSYNTNAEVGVKVVADVSTKKTDIYVDGVLRASDVDFRNNVSNIDGVYLYTGTTGIFTLNQRFMYVYKGYLVNERFLAGANENVPGDWSVNSSGGTVSVKKNEDAAPPPDYYSVKMDDTSTSNSVSMSKAFASQTDKVEFEYKFMQPTKNDGFIAELSNGSTAAVKIEMSSGNICYVNSSGSKVSVWNSYLGNVWYYIRVTADMITHTADIYINDIKKATGVSFTNTSMSSVDTVKFTTSTTNTDVVWLDDIQVYPFQDYPSDYVPQPVPVPHGSYKVGVQACNLWREGTHNGWDWISNDADRTPIIGCYDEGNSEVSDWEIKFMVDHSIDFTYPCWYRPRSGTGAGPIKDGVLNAGLNAYKRAKYSDYLEYSLILEAANHPMKSMSDWQNNIVPFLIEHYFKDPRYLVIDNKPVIGFYGGVGGTGDNAAAVSYLNSACISAGFSGVTTINNESNSSFDYDYVYCESNSAESNPLRISSPSVNWDTYCWTAPYLDGGASWKSADTYKNLLTAQKAAMINKTGLAQTMLLLDNWNEYGEGHFLMPTEGLGFGYIDALREVFGDGSAHTDITPTAQQKARLDILYPKAW